MKAKFIQIAAAMSLLLENNTNYMSNKGESKEDFIARVKSETELEFELEIEELTTETFSKMSIEQLNKAAATEKRPLLAKLMLLAAKEQKTKPSTKAKVAAAVNETKTDATPATEESKGPTPAEIKAQEAAAKKAEKEAAKAKQAEEKAELAKTKAAEKEAKEVAKAEALKNKPTLEQITVAALECKANTNHLVTFKAHKTGEDVQGIINGVWIDKRVPMALYRIFGLNADGTPNSAELYNKTIFSDEITIGEKAVDTKAEAKAAEAELKAKAKEEAAEKKAADKKAKEEAKQNAANEKAAAAIEKSRLKEEAAEIAKANAAASQSDSDAALAQLAAEAKADSEAE